MAESYFPFILWFFRKNALLNLSLQFENEKELVWNIIGFGKYNENTHFLRKSLLIKNGLGRNYQPFTEPKFP